MENLSSDVPYSSHFQLPWHVTFQSHWFWQSPHSQLRYFWLQGPCVQTACFQDTAFPVQKKWNYMHQLFLNNYLATTPTFWLSSDMIAYNTIHFNFTNLDRYGVLHVKQYFGHWWRKLFTSATCNIMMKILNIGRDLEMEKGQRRIRIHNMYTQYV